MDCREIDVPSSYKRTIMSVSYHMKLFNQFITTIRLKYAPDYIPTRDLRKKNSGKKISKGTDSIFFVSIYFKSLSNSGLRLNFKTNKTS